MPVKEPYGEVREELSEIAEAAECLRGDISNRV